MMSTVARSAKGAAITIPGLNSIPTETKNRTAKASRSGSDSVAACWLSRDSDSIMPAEKAPSARDATNTSPADTLCRGIGNPECDRQHREAKQLAAAGMRHVMQDRRDQLLADDQHDGDEDREFAEHEPDLARDRGRVRRRFQPFVMSGQDTPQHE